MGIPAGLHWTDLDLFEATVVAPMVSGPFGSKELKDGRVLLTLRGEPLYEFQ
jgi:hypothetical protein